MLWVAGMWVAHTIASTEVGVIDNHEVVAI